MWTGFLSSNFLIVYEKITGIVRRFFEIERNGNIYLSTSQVIFVKRILQRADMTHVLFGVVMTASGFAKP
jgi:hypothetical protein